MQGVFEQTLISGSAVRSTTDPFGEKIGIVGTLFGCWHRRLTKPISIGRQSYRSCTECGARRQFDTENFTTSGPFYYPPSADVRQ